MKDSVNIFFEKKRTLEFEVYIVTPSLLKKIRADKYQTSCKYNMAGGNRNSNQTGCLRPEIGVV